MPSPLSNRIMRPSWAILDIHAGLPCKIGRLLLSIVGAESGNWIAFVARSQREDPSHLKKKKKPLSCENRKWKVHHSSPQTFLPVNLLAFRKRWRQQTNRLNLRNWGWLCTNRVKAAYFSATKRLRYIKSLFWMSIRPCDWSTCTTWYKIHFFDGCVPWCLTYINDEVTVHKVKIWLKYQGCGGNVTWCTSDTPNSLRYLFRLQNRHQATNFKT